MEVEEENWEYTLNFYDANINYHVPLNTVLGLSLTRRFTQETFDDNMFGNIAEFRGHVRDRVRQIAEAYDMAQNVDTAAITTALREEYEIDLDADWDGEDPPYSDYAYVNVEYVINGEQATITVSDHLDQDGDGYPTEIYNRSPVLLTIAVEGSLDQNAILQYSLHIANLLYERNIGVDIMRFPDENTLNLVAIFPYHWNNRTQIDNYVRAVWRSIRNDGEVEIDAYNIDWRGMDESRNEASVTIRTTLIAAIPQYVDQLVQGEQYRVLRKGETLTLAQFQQIGRYYIEEKLIYDNYLLEAKDVGCMGLNIGSENVEFPVRTSGGGIFCMIILSGWIAAGNTTDPKRAPIQFIHVMNEEEIMQQEWADIQNERRRLDTEINNLNKEKEENTDNKRGQEIRRELIQKQNQLAKLPPTPQEHMAKKLERMGMNRVRPKLKF